MAGLSELINRLSRPPEDLRAENLRRWAASVPEATPIDQVELRSKCIVAGVIQNVRIDPREGRDSVEATIIDGTGALVAKWLGRPSMSGIRLGMGLVILGVVGAGDDGDLVILNPEYKLVPGPEHG